MGSMKMHSMFSLMALVLTPSFVPVTPPPPEGPTCGLGASFHSGRRAELLRHAKDGLLLFRGLPETRAYLEFRQDKTFWYLTGVESPGAALLMDAKSGRQVLFLPRPNPGKESWEGEIWE